MPIPHGGFREGKLSNGVEIISRDEADGVEGISMNKEEGAAPTINQGMKEHG